MKNEEKACLLNALIAVRYLGKESVRCRPHTEGKAEVVRGKVKTMPPKKNLPQFIDIVLKGVYGGETNTPFTNSIMRIISA